MFRWVAGSFEGDCQCLWPTCKPQHLLFEAFGLLWCRWCILSGRYWQNFLRWSSNGRLRFICHKYISLLALYDKPFATIARLRSFRVILGARVYQVGLREHLFHLLLSQSASLFCIAYSGLCKCIWCISHNNVGNHFFFLLTLRASFSWMYSNTMMWVVLGWELAVLPRTSLISICSGLYSGDSGNIFGEALLVEAKLITLLECWVPLMVVSRVSGAFCTVVTFELNERLRVISWPAFVLKRFNTFPLFSDIGAIDSQTSRACYITFRVSHALLVQKM